MSNEPTIPAKWAEDALSDLDKMKKVTDTVKAYLDALSEVDTINMKATVRLFSKAEIKEMAENADNNNKKAFLTVAAFLKGIQSDD